MSLTATTKALPLVTAGVVGSVTVWKPIWGRVPLVILLVPILDTQPFEYLGSAKSRAAYVYLPNVRPSAETHLSHLDDTTRRSLRPSVARVIYAEGIPVVPVP